MYGYVVTSKTSPFLFSLLFCAMACSGAASNAGSVVNPALSSNQAAQHTQLIQQGDALWAKRAEPGQAQAAIGKWEKALELQPADPATALKVSRAYFFAAGGWLSLLPASERIQLHKRGVAVAEQGLKAQSKQFARLRSQGAKFEDAVKVIERPGIGLVYWYGANLGAQAYASGMAEGLKLKSRVENTIKHVYEVDPSYARYGADQFMATFYAAAPPFIGGDMKKADEHFEVLAKKAPNNLAALLLKARFYAVRKKDRALFDKLKKQILDAKPCDAAAPVSPCIEKGYEPEAALQKHKAAKLSWP